MICNSDSRHRRPVRKRYLLRYPEQPRVAQRATSTAKKMQKDGRGGRVGYDAVSLDDDALPRAILSFQYDGRRRPLPRTVPGCTPLRSHARAHTNEHKISQRKSQYWICQLNEFARRRDMGLFGDKKVKSCIFYNVDGR